MTRVSESAKNFLSSNFLLKSFLLVSTGFIVVHFFLRSPQSVTPTKVDPETKRFNEKMDKISSERTQLMMDLISVESVRDKNSYMAHVNKMATLDIELDSMFDDVLQKKGVVLESSTGFTEAEKIDMLALQFNLSSTQMLLLKKEIEILFEDDYREQYQGEIEENDDYDHYQY